MKGEWRIRSQTFWSPSIRQAINMPRLAASFFSVWIKRNKRGRNEENAKKPMQKDVSSTHSHLRRRQLAHYKGSASAESSRRKCRLDEATLSQHHQERKRKERREG